MSIIKLNKSIIPSCDVADLDKLKKLVKETCSVKGIGAYKIGLELCLRYGIPEVVKTIRKYTKLPIIYERWCKKQTMEMFEYSYTCSAAGREEIREGGYPA